MHHKSWQLLVTLALCWFFSPGAGAFDSRAVGTDCAVCQLGDEHFESVGDAESIPDNNITALAQDGDGFLWLGTPSGLVRYDGYRFRRFTLQPGADGAVRGVFVRDLMVASDGRIWMGTDADGLWVFDPGSEQFEVFRHRPNDPTSLMHDTVRALVEDNAGGIWIGTRAGLNYLPPGDGQLRGFPQRLGADTGALDDRILALMVDRSDNLWVGSWNGLSRQTAGSGVFHRVHGTPAEYSLEGVQILSLRLLDDGRVGVGTAQRGSYLLNPRDDALLAIPIGTDSAAGVAAYSLVMLQPRPGELWMGGFGGIMVVDSDSGEFLRQLEPDPSIASSLAHSEVRTMLLDRAGDVWIGGFGGGLQRHNPNNQSIRVLHHSPAKEHSLSSPSVSAVLELEDGQIWVGTRENGVDIVDRQRGVIGGWRANPEDPEALVHPMVLSLAHTADGSVWVGTLTELHRHVLGSDGFLRYPTAQGLKGNTARRLLPGRNGELWIGSTAGLLRWTPTDDQIRSLPDQQGGRGTTDINAMALAQDGRLWAGAASGLYTVSPAGETLEQIRGADQASRHLLDSTVVGILIDRSQQLWVDTNNGLLRLIDFGADGAHFERVAQRPGAPIEPFGANLLEDAHGRIWTHHHLYDPKTGSVHELSRADGADLGTGWYRSYAATSDGLMLFGGSYGLMMVDPNRYRPWSYQPPLVISELRVDGQVLEPRVYAAGLNLAATAQRLQLEFSALDYSAPARNRYRYRLVGYDQDWIASDAGRRLASYNNLWPGDYQLEVLGSNRVGDWVDEPLRLPVRVLPKYWQTPWFVALALLLVLLVIVLCIRWQTGRLRRQQRALSKLVDARTGQLSQAKEDAEDALDQLQSTQQQLVAAEKLASLGQLVAGVAHEINTPLGTALTAASLARDETRNLALRYHDQRLRNQDLGQFLETAERAHALVDSNLTRAVQLVSSFKQISVDRSLDERHQFDLGERLQGLVDNLRLSWRTRPVELSLNCPPGLTLDSYPGTLGQVINNLCQNALLHAYDDAEAGQMRLEVRLAAGDRIKIRFCDDGKGIAQEDLTRVFDPFHTTLRARGCIGLGLHTVFNLVHARLGGRVSVESELGKGTCFVIDIPSSAPT